jgi:3-hydroxy-9,10-secoandrosta-1,3,5(10)-triene-9,17-dione monooxygenase reductase component
MARWPTGVAVVTSRDAGGDAGLTVNGLISVSLAPMRLLISLTETADTTSVVRRSGVFAANFLSAAQRAVSERFAQTLTPAEKFAGLAVHRGLTGAPLLDGAVAQVECQVRDATRAGDHVLFLGEVVGLYEGPDATPLLYYHSGYAEPTGERGLTLAPPRC